MKKIAIIGAGIFGLESAKQFSQRGFHVTVYERNDEILNEGTANSVLRLHLGLHYPRDTDTALQSIIGYGQFLEHYREFVNLNFENYYAISRSDSKIDEKQFISFAEKVGISITEVPSSTLHDLGFDSSKISAAWKCEEGVIDISTLRAHFQQILKNNVEFHKSCEVTKVSPTNDKWIIEDSHGRVEEFDYIVQATYGTDRIATPLEISSTRLYEYHKTLALEVKCKVANFGLTVIDGDFITVLPKGFEDSLLIYGPNPSVLQRSTGTHFPRAWEDETTFNLQDSAKNIVDRLREWFPRIGEVEIVKLLTTVRSIQPNMQSTDKRVSSVREPAKNYFIVWSGKIDHCVGIAEQIIAQLSRKE